MLLTFLGLDTLIGELVNLPHEFFFFFLRIKCTDICKELRQCLACTKSSLNIRIISAQQPFQTLKQQRLSEDKPESSGVEIALWPGLKGWSLGAHHLALSCSGGVIPRRLCKLLFWFWFMHPESAMDFLWQVASGVLFSPMKHLASVAFFWTSHCYSL